MNRMGALETTGLITNEGTPVPLVGVAADGMITGRAAKMRIRQRFENCEDVAIEAVYKFPLPEGCSVCGFTISHGDRVLRGEVEEREEAFRRYDEALEQGNGAYLLDEERPNIFTLSVGNVPPRHAVEIEVSYVSLLATNAGEVRFSLPTTISPRYVPADTPDQDGIPVADLVNPDFRLDVPYGLSLHLDLHGRTEIAGVESPSHPIRTGYTDDAISVEFSSDTVAMDHDFVLTIRYAEEFESRAYSFEDDDHRFVQVDFCPRLDDVTTDAGLASEVVFLLDCSGSMGGSSIAQAKKALEVFLRGLPSGALFNVYRFGSTFESLFPESGAYDSGTLQAALHYLSCVHADLGGTELLAPLRRIYETPVSGGVIRNVVLLTDGQIGNEAEVLNLVQRDSHTRLFTVGIGYGPNEHLTKRLAAVTQGATESVAPGERIESKVLRLFGKVMRGAVEDLVLDWGAHAEQAPARPVVYDGECVSILARLPQDADVPASIRLTGSGNGEVRHWDVPVARADDAAVAMPLLWARERIAEIEEGTSAVRGSRQVGRKELGLDTEVVALSKQYGLLSRSTSFVTVESRVDADKCAEMQLRKVPSMLTRGWGGMEMGVADAYMSMGPQFPACGPAMVEPPNASYLRASKGRKRSQGDLDLSAFPGAMECAAVSHDRLQEILSTQTFEGGFELSDYAVAGAIGLDLAELHDAARRMMDGGQDPLKLVCSAVILELLEREYADRRNEWSAVTLKTRKWLYAEVQRLDPSIDGTRLAAWAAEYVARMGIGQD